MGDRMLVGSDGAETAVDGEGGAVDGGGLVAVGQWRAEIATGVANMQAAGEVSADLEPGRTAAAIVAGIQGGVVM
jgi:hypothetical protein